MNHQRAMNAFLGLALGDMYGAPLEFLYGEDVKETPVDMTKVHWTDDTHMALYLGEAVLQTLAPFDQDAFGEQVGIAFSRWLRDPLMPHTAPGNTCLAGSRALASGKTWRQAGVRGSDGCGAVMRIAPLPMRWAGKELDAAAFTQAWATHASPNATVGAIVLSRITRALLDGASLSEKVIRDALGGPSLEGLEVRLACLAAVNLYRAGVQSGEEAVSSIPGYDGGWHTPSAIGLALWAVLTGGSFATIVERAARIDGDSDSVAAIAGMLAGAQGMELPEAWVSVIPRRSEVERLVEQLVQGANLGTVRT